MLLQPSAITEKDMSSNTIVLIQPLGTLSQPSGYMRTCHLEPITLEYLAAAAEAEGYEVGILSGSISDDEIAEVVQAHPAATAPRPRS